MEVGLNSALAAECCELHLSEVETGIGAFPHFELQSICAFPLSCTVYHKATKKSLKKLLKNNKLWYETYTLPRQYNIYQYCQL